METSGIIFLVISCAISFGLGRTVVYFRDKKRKKLEQERVSETTRNRPVEPESKNKSKRKRQLQQLGKSGKNR